MIPIAARPFQSWFLCKVSFLISLAGFTILSAPLHSDLAEGAFSSLYAGIMYQGMICLLMVLIVITSKLTSQSHRHLAQSGTFPSDRHSNISARVE
jgi:hypothetical protein